jgi:hypothetical protein
MVGYHSSPNVLENITLQGTNSITGTHMAGGIVGGGFFYNVYASYRGLNSPTAFAISNSTSSGSMTGDCTDLVGKIAGYIYDH